MVNLWSIQRIFLKLKSDHVTPVLKTPSWNKIWTQQGLLDLSLPLTPSTLQMLTLGSWDKVKSCMGLLAASGTGQICSCLRALALAVSSAWNLLPQSQHHSLLPLGVCSNVSSWLSYYLNICFYPSLSSLILLYFSFIAPSQTNFVCDLSSPGP